MADAPKPASTPKTVQHVGGESLVERLLPHVKQIGIGVIVLAVALSAYFGYRAHQRGDQADATARFTKVNALALRPIEAPPAAPPAADPADPTHPATPPAPPVVDPDHPTFPDRATRATGVLSELGAAGNQTGGHAFRAGFLMDAGKLDEAIAEYKAGSTGEDIEAVLCREGLGLAYEAKGMAATDAAQKQQSYEASLAAFTSMQVDPTGPRYAYALYHQGRLQETLGKKAEAKATFEKVKGLDDTKHELAGLVAKRLAALGAT